MGVVREGMRGSGNLFLCLCIFAATLAVHCDSRKTVLVSKDPNTIINSHLKNLKTFKHLDIDPTLLDTTSTSPQSSNAQPYLNSPSTLPPPFDHPLSSASLSDSSSNPYCLNPPSTPVQTLPTPSSSIPIAQNPPPTPTTTAPPSPSQSIPSPSIPTPNPTPPESSSDPTPATPSQSPPGSEPGPPSQGSYPYVPSPPTEFEPSPPLFFPPVVYPPPTASPPSGGGGEGGGGRGSTSGALWCVAKPSVPDPIIQEAMNYACGSGADCEDIQQSGKCHEPDTLFAHASFAFNSYWQRTKVAGGTCDFGGTAMLVTVDPSYDGCRFIYA